MHQPVCTSTLTSWLMPVMMFSPQRGGSAPPAPHPAVPLTWLNSSSAYISIRSTPSDIFPQTGAGTRAETGAKQEDGRCTAAGQEEGGEGGQ